jgi:hypothetical protein
MHKLLILSVIFAILIVTTMSTPTASVRKVDAKDVDLACTALCAKWWCCTFDFFGVCGSCKGVTEPTGCLCREFAK